MSLVSLNLYDPLLYGNGQLGSYTALFAKTWRRSIRRRGGFYLGTVELTGDDLTRAEMDEFFRYRLLAEIREVGGGQETWRGALMKMEYQRGPQLMTVDMTRMANAVRVLYTRIFPNLLTNGSGESGAWTVCTGVGGTTGAATVTQSTTWRTDGLYSIKIVVASAAIEGAWVQQITPIVANQSYVITGSLNVVSGSWRVSCNRLDDDQSLCFFSTRGGGAGDYTVNMIIPATNTYAGNVDLRITSEGAAGTIYADGFNFSIAPIPNVQTGWYEDLQSIAIYGRKETTLLEIGKTTEAANAEAQSYLNRWGWPHPFPPNNYTTRAEGKATGDRLTLTFAGYWAMLNWYNVPISISSGTSSALVQSLVNLQSTYVTTGSIETNTTNYKVDNRGTLLVGDTIKDICGDGKAGGQLYEAGVYENRLFRYLSVTPELTYHLRGGDLYSVSDSLYEPWLARPGYALWQDIPLGPGTLANPQDDPRWAYLEEVEMLPGGQLTFNLEPSV